RHRFRKRLNATRPPPAKSTAGGGPRRSADGRLTVRRRSLNLKTQRGGPIPMLSSWLQQPVKIREVISDDIFEPAHAEYYDGPPGKPLRLLLQARSDFLSIWRASDYAEKVSQIRILGRQVVLVNSPELIRQVVVKRQENFER